MKMKKIIALFLLVTMATLAFTACADDTEINIGVLAGPTGIGMAKLMADEAQSSNSNYKFTVFTKPEEAIAALSNGSLDMACLPTNGAANLSILKQDFISVAAINTLGSLYLLNKSTTSINSVSDLEGKTIYTTVPGSTTEPILRHILEENQVNANIEILADHAALVAEIAKGTVELAVLPEPMVTLALEKNQSYSVALNLSSEWAEISDEPLAMGCIVVRNDFLKKNKKSVNRFLDKYEDSIEFMNNSKRTDEAVDMIVDMRILPQLSSKALVKKALTNLYGSIDYIDGDDMKEALQEFYTVIGQSQPDRSFYYED